MYKAKSENKLYVFLVFLPDSCVSVALRMVGYAAAPLPCLPVKILRDLVKFFSAQFLTIDMEGSPRYIAFVTVKETNYVVYTPNGYKFADFAKFTKFTKFKMFSGQNSKLPHPRNLAE